MTTRLTIVFRPLVCAIAWIAVANVAVAEPSGERNVDDMMKRADTDGDGKVSRDEFMKAQTARLEEMFSRMDTNGDGKLSREEVAEGRVRMRELMQRNGQGPGGRGLPDRGSRGPEQGFRRPPQQN